MAVIPTGAIFNKLVFGSVDSSDYGIYITGEAVYNAPQRAVEMVSVPGRNGAIEIDQGRWENLEVTYSAGCFGDNQSDFATNIRNFRNAVCSQIGYQKLTDTYNPNEYRMALYLSGLDVSPESLSRAGKFKITFDCKPQRWLVSGEAAVNITSGQYITNPTQYPSKPFLEAKGYGNISFNGFIIRLNDEQMGLLKYTDTSSTAAIRFYQAVYETGDDITADMTANDVIETTQSYFAFDSPSITINDSNSDFHTSFIETSTRQLALTTEVRGEAFVGGTSKTATNTVTISANIIDTNTSTSYPTTYTFTQNMVYTPTLNTTQSEIALQRSYSGANKMNHPSGTYNTTFNITIFSTASVLGNPTYIDCEVGEAYRIIGNQIIPLNAYISFGADLPELAAGENRILTGLNITELKLTPNWWQL